METTADKLYNMFFRNRVAIYHIKDIRCESELHITSRTYHSLLDDCTYHITGLDSKLKEYELLGNYKMRNGDLLIDVVKGSRCYTYGEALNRFIEPGGNVYLVSNRKTGNRWRVIDVVTDGVWLRDVKNEMIHKSSFDQLYRNYHHSVTCDTLCGITLDYPGLNRAEEAYQRLNQKWPTDIDGARKMFNGKNIKIKYRNTGRMHEVMNIDRKGGMVLCRDNGELWTAHCKDLNRLFYSSPVESEEVIPYTREEAKQTFFGSSYIVDERDGSEWEVRRVYDTVNGIAVTLKLRNNKGKAIFRYITIKELAETYCHEMGGKCSKDRK